VRFLTILTVALRSIQRAPIRSSLTVLGVVIGVAAVVCTVDVGLAAKARIEERLATPEARTVSLRARAPRNVLRRTRSTLAAADRLQPADYYAVIDELQGLSAASLQIQLPAAQLQANGLSMEAALEGIDAEGIAISARRLVKGASLTAADVHRAETVVLLTESLARELFFSESPLDRIVRVNEIPFTIKGVVTDRTIDDPFQRNANELRAFIPFTSLLQRIDRGAEISIIVQVQDVEHVLVVQRATSDLIEQRRNGRKSEFLVTNGADAIRAYAEGSHAVARLLASVGTISLLVGGIGIMNIMLVTVTERTREIGIRMAIGTRARDILNQFLIEAITLSLAGGLVGIVIGIGAAQLVAYWNDWPAKLSLSSLLVAFACSTAVGVFFGYHPARRAAQLNPVAALRS
jgi:putative ABC transport system permease protein